VKAKPAAMERLGLAFQQFSKLDWHRLRGRVSYVPTLQVTGQIALKVIQISAKDDGDLCPFSIVAKHPAVSNEGDNLAGLRIADVPVPCSLGISRCLTLHRLLRSVHLQETRVPFPQVGTSPTTGGFNVAV
jgi:hypothetical protein